jgi:hypothetical protein
VLIRNSCIILYEAENIIGDTCMAIRPDNALRDVIQGIFALHDINITSFITDIHGNILLHPKLVRNKTEYTDLILVKTPDIMYNTSSKEKQEFSNKYKYHLDKINHEPEEDQQFFFMMDEVKYIMRLINSRDRNEISKGVIGFYIDFGVIEKGAIIIEKELNDYLKLGFRLGMVAIIILLFHL